MGNNPISGVDPDGRLTVAQTRFLIDDAVVIDDWGSRDGGMHYGLDLGRTNLADNAGTPIRSVTEGRVA